MQQTNARRVCSVFIAALEWSEITHGNNTADSVVRDKEYEVGHEIILFRLRLHQL